MKRNTIIGMMFATLVVLGCTREPLSLEVGLGPVSSAETVELNVSTNVSGVESVTKSTSLMQSGIIGIFVCDHHEGSGNPYTPHANGMDNIKATLTTRGSTQSWMFKFSNMTSAFPTLVLTAKKDAAETPVLADVFAYYPYAETVRTPEAVPFKAGIDSTHVSFSELYRDLMYAEENASPTVNKAIDPQAKDPMTGEKLETVDVPFTFRHALARIRFNVTVNNSQYNHPDGDGTMATNFTLNSIILRKKSGHLYGGGIMDAITGELSDLVEVSKLSVAYGTKQNKMPFANIVPTQPGEDYVDGDYEFRFVINGVEIGTPFVLLREHLRHGDSDVYGFKAGYEYTFNFVYDSFVRFTGVEIGEWEVKTDPLYEIEI